MGIARRIGGGWTGSPSTSFLALNQLIHAALNPPRRLNLVKNIPQRRIKPDVLEKHGDRALHLRIDIVRHLHGPEETSEYLANIRVLTDNLGDDRLRYVARLVVVEDGGG